MALAPTHPETFESATALPAGPAPRRWRSASDEVLVRAAARGDHGAMAAIDDRYRAPLERYCRTIVLHHQDAQDAAQAALAAGLRALVDGRAQPQALRAWLYRIAHREALAVLRRRPPVGVGDETLLELLPASRQDRVESRAELAELLGDLQALPERSRSALVLHELAGLSFDEVAQTLEISPGAARQAAYEARTKLRAGRADLAGLFPAGPALTLAGGAATATATGGVGLLGGLFGGAGVAAKCAAVCATLGVVGAGSFTVAQPPVPRDERPAKVERPAAQRPEAAAAATPRTTSRAPVAVAPDPAVARRAAAARQERRKQAARHRRATVRDRARERERAAARERAETTAPAADAAPDVTSVDVEESPTGGAVPQGTQPSTPSAPVASADPVPEPPTTDGPVGSGAVTGTASQDVVSITVQ